MWIDLEIWNLDHIDKKIFCKSTEEPVLYLSTIS